jgi:hypothetical protein
VETFYRRGVQAVGRPQGEELAMANARATELWENLVIEFDDEPGVGGES